MANKQLTARVRINSTQAEQKLRNIARAIDNLNRLAGRQSTAYNQVNAALNRTDATARNVATNTKRNVRHTREWSTQLSDVNAKLKGSSRTMSLIGSKLRSLATTYLGIMGTRAVIDTSDTLISAENRMNYVNAQNLGSKGFNADGSYTQAAINSTKESLDKMYVSSQKVRMSYNDMISNVSKSMTLAGDAFDNNTDKAIRFQEIMAEAYTIGGATAQEMSTSMYQLIQGLSGNLLAGDELRSVREGAPLAYKAIEEFAQGVYNSDESLKDLASQGKITADIVTAAILGIGDDMDKAFKQTNQTFAQTWNQIKNVAVKSFEPVATLFKEKLNSAVDNGLIDKVSNVFKGVVKVILIAFAVIEKSIGWIADNWNWLKHIIVGVFILWITWTLIKTGISIACAIQEFIAWAKVNSQLLTQLLIIGIVMIAILALLYVVYLWKQGTIDSCMAIVIALLIVGAAVLLIGIIIGSLPMIIIGAVILLLAVIFMFFEEVCYGAGWLAAWIVNIVFGILNFLCAVMAVIVTFFYNLVADIVNGTMGIWNVIKAITENIGIAFSNAWTWAKNTFWEFIADVIDGISKLEPVINGIAKLLDKEGVNFGELSSSIRSRKGEYKSYVSVSDAWSSGLNTMDRLSYGDSWNAGLSTIDYVDANAWGSTAGNWGAGVKDSINQWGSKFQQSDKKDKTSLLDSIGNKLGLDFSDIEGGLPSLDDPAYDLAGLGDDLSGKAGNIDDNTKSAADSLKLTEEDLKYLRQMADMEWKKEYTTANITVDMTNNNTINGESDLDGIVTKLSDKLYEEMNIVANGVYVY